MKNFRGNGNSVQLAAPAGGVVGGQMYGVGSLIGVVVADAAEAELFTLFTKGEFEGVKKKAGETWAVGDILYYDPADNALTKTAGALKQAGIATVAVATAGDVLGSILLHQ